jgi:putative transposase
MKTYKYRIYPTKSQIGKLENTFSMCRHLYNWSLAERNTAYLLRRYSSTIENSINPDEKSIFSTCFGQLLFPAKNEPAAVGVLTTIDGIFGITFSAVWEGLPRNVNYNYQSSKLPGMKKEKPWYRFVHSQVLQDSLKRLEGAYGKFYNGLKEGNRKEGFPRFKKKGQWDSITYPQYKVAPEGKTIYVSKIGDVKIILHRKIPVRGIVKTMSIKKANGKWFACFSVEIPKKKTEHKPDLSKAIGLDMGLIDFYYASDGSHIPVPRYFRKNERRLKRLQRKFQEIRDKYKGKDKPKKYYKLLRAIQKVHYRIKCQREDFLHKQANRLLREFDVIIHEDLTIRNMVRRPKPKKDEEGKYLPNRASIKAGLNKSINDVGWYKFLLILKYKALAQGKLVIGVDPKNTSQICSGCGKTVVKTLCERTHNCPHCGLNIPRDYNSALYIKGLGLKSLSKRFALEAPTIPR